MGCPTSLNAVEGPPPACLVEEVNKLMKGRSCLLFERDFVYLRFGHIDRPVDEQGSSQDILPGHKPPIAAVHAVCAVITHHEIIARRDDQVIALNLRG